MVEKDKLEGDLVDYEMYVDVFSGAFSPRCCNYALRKTVVVNTSDFKAGLAKTSMKNFYVDNFFMLVEFEDSAIQLIQDARKICQYGGFNLSLLPTEKVIINQFQRIIERMVSRTKILTESYL